MTSNQKARDLEFYEGQIETLARRLDRGEITAAEYVRTRAHVQTIMAETRAAETRD